MQLKDLVHQVGKVTFPHRIIVPGGTFKTAEQLRKVLPTEIIPEWGSITTNPSNGNGGRDYHAEYRGSVLICTTNSLGLPNPGMTYVEQHAADLIREYDDGGKPLIINISGNGIDDTMALLRRAIACGFKVITINGACPNKPGQPMICWDKAAVDELFECIDREVGATDVVILWKVSLGMPMDLLEHNRYKVAYSTSVTGIVTGNTIANFRLQLDDGGTAIKTERGIMAGGLAGPLVQGFALDAVGYCALQMPAGKIVLGIGGISTARHVERFLRAGATLVGIQSAFREANESPQFIQDILTELIERG